MQPRPARMDDLLAIETIVMRAFAVYVPRLRRRPAPMGADYHAHVAAGEVHVLDDGRGGLQGLAVLLPHPDHLLVDVLAVDPDRQGRGVGTALMAFAEDRARALGLDAVELYTNVKMTENLVFYPRRGYAEVGRERVRGLHRVRFRKPLT